MATTAHSPETFTSSVGVFAVAELTPAMRAALSSVGGDGQLEHCFATAGAALVRLGLARKGILATWTITHAGWNVLAELPIEHTIQRSVSAVWCACGEFSFRSERRESREAAVGHHRASVKREQAARDNLARFA